jgi:hypothetical protein
MKQPQVRYKRHRFGREQDTRTRGESAHEERMLDDALDQTFPASDPPAQTMPHDTSPGGKDAPARSSSRNRKLSRKH